MALATKEGLSPSDQVIRKKLLAIIHIAKEDLAWTDTQYRLMLSAAFDVPTAAALTNEQLQSVVDYFISKYGWTPKANKDKRSRTRQIDVLQQRAIEFVIQLPGGRHRFNGLCRKLCGVDKIQWCNDVAKLKRLLAAMGNIKRRETG